MSGVRYCCVKYCANNDKNNRNISFFRFPKEYERCNKWIRNCGRTDLAEKGSDYCYAAIRICSAHFEDVMFASLLKNRLCRNAVPTLFNSIRNSHYPKFARALLRINKNLVFIRIHFRISFQLHFEVHFVQVKVNIIMSKIIKTKKRKRVVISAQEKLSAKTS
ncbi:hypothetical protein RI129_004720 [Pyrocoelia pectoralis]|uniref:THAP-type domain-containing protein n=1 Tax=Pyrocoelia pectoralis TaxID=417401 RepID=A0AAN7VIR7_9COLE